MILEAEQKLLVKRINEIRKEHGLGRITKLKRGVPKHLRACTLSMSLEGTGINAYEFYSMELKRPEGFEIAPAINDVVAAFDRGELPELEISKATTVKIKKPGERKSTEVPL